MNQSHAHTSNHMSPKAHHCHGSKDKSATMGHDQHSMMKVIKI